MRIVGTLIASTAMLAMAACTSMTPSEQGAVSGAVIGGAAGWYLGCRNEGRCGAVENRRQHYDQRSGRYYFQDSRSGHYFYENGQPYP